MANDPNKEDSFFTSGLQDKINKTRLAIQNANKIAEGSPKKDYSQEDFKFVPEEKKPLAFQNVNQPLTFADDAQKDFFKEVIVSELNALPEPDKQSIKENLGQQKFKTDEDKISFMKDQLLLKKANRLPDQLKTTIKDFSIKNKLSKEQTKELLSQAVVLPQNSLDRVLAFTETSGKDIADKSFEDFKKIFVDQSPSNTPEGEVDLSKSIEKIQSNLKMLKENRTLRAFFDGDENVQKLLEIDPRTIEQINGKGNLLSAVFGMAQRSGQFGAAALLGYKSLVSKDPDTQEAYKYLAGQVYDDAISGSLWLPPKSGFDTFDMFNLIGDRKEVADTQVADSLFMQGMKSLAKGDPLKFTMSMVASLTLKKKLHEDFMDKNGLDLMEYGKRQLYNLGLTTMGFISAIATDPLNLIFETGALKVGGEGLKGLKVAEKIIPAKTLNKKAMLEASKTLEAELTSSLSKITKTKIGFDDIADAEKFVGDVESFIGKNPKFTDSEMAKNILQFRDVNERFKVIGEVKDKLITLDAAVNRKGLMLDEAQSLISQLDDQAEVFANLTKAPKPVDVNKEFAVFVKDGTQRLSKQGQQLLSKYRKATPIFDEVKGFQDELAVAKEAFTNPKLVDGGVKVFGLEIPGTKFVESEVKDLMSKVPVLNRFPGINKQASTRIHQYLREFEGRQKLSNDFISSSLKNLSEEQKIRISFAIESGKIEQLNNTIKVNELGTLQDIAKTVNTKFDDYYFEAMNANKNLFAMMKNRGFDDKEILEAVEKEGGDLMGQYIENYQPLIFKNKKAIEAIEVLKKGKRDAVVDQSTKKYIRAFNANAFDPFSLKRNIPNRAEAYKMFAPNMESKIDTAIGDIINGVNVKDNVRFLTKIGKDGLDPEIGLQELMFARFRAGDKAILRRRLNINLAEELGIKSSIANYMEESGTLVTGNAIEFKGVKIPSDVKTALMRLDAPSTKTRLEMELTSGKPFNKETGALSTDRLLTSIEKGQKFLGFHLLNSVDKVNNFFKTAVTQVFPKFHTRNAVSNVLMNYQDLGVTTFDPVLNSKVFSMVNNMNTKGFGKEMVFTNKFGQIMNGEEMLHAAKENGVFTEFRKLAERNGAEKYSQMFLKNPLAKFGQANEDYARLLNFIGNWKNGNSFLESSARSRKMLIDYSNVSDIEHEWLNRVLPFWTFFRQNFVNTAETLIKRPDRIFMPARVGSELMGADIKTPEGFSPNTQFSQAPVYTDEKVNDEGKRTVRQVTSMGLPFEDVNRFFDVINEAYKGWRYLQVGDETQSANSFKNAQRGAIWNLMPTLQLPIAVWDQATGGNLFFKKKLDDRVANYLTETTPAIRNMVGLDFRVDKKGEVIAEVSPIANIMFSMMGGSRFLSTAQSLSDDSIDAIDKINAFISPISTKTIDVEEAKLFEKQMKAKQIKDIGNFFKKSLKDLGKQKGLEKLFKENTGGKNGVKR